MAEASSQSAHPAGQTALSPGDTGREETLTPDQLPPPPSGERFPQVTGYEILAELGRGGMGVVYRARQLGLNRLVALKMILAGPFADADSKARFRAEAAAVAQLQHPNIVQIFHIGEERGLIYFSLELVEKGSLQHKLAGQPQPATEAARLVETLARAVDAAHRRGIVHRDLKPANILLTDDGTPKITDFGLAKQLGQQGLSSPGDVLGTPSYMAPEQASGSGPIGPATDVYALGAILYEMLTGQPPFRAGNVVATLDQVRFAPPVPPRQIHPGVPVALESICLHCLRKDPQQRFASAAALAEELHRFLEETRTQAPPAAGQAMPMDQPRPEAASASPVAGAPLTFRVLREEAVPMEGELWIRPRRSAGQDGQTMQPIFERPARSLHVARLVFEQGPEALERGPGPVTSIVINAAGTQPTFDDMLASLFVQVLLARPQAALPASFGSLAKYAELLRQGKTPTRLPPEETLEGIYLGIRNLAGDDLSDAAVARRFLEGWQRIAECLTLAGEDEIFQKPLFSSSAFAEVKAYLLEDQRRYRRDVLQGQKWTIRLPHSTRPESGLLLSSPRSALFPYWSRRDEQTPTGDPYLFLAVCWGPKNWVFSTDPAHDGLSLQELAQALQKEENAAKGTGQRQSEAQARAVNDNDAPQWYDGRRHHYTLVASPEGGGTQLSDRRVLAIVRKWLRARRPLPIPWPLLLLAACAMMGLILLLLALVLR